MITILHLEAVQSIVAMSKMLRGGLLRQLFRTVWQYPKTII